MIRWETSADWDRGIRAREIECKIEQLEPKISYQYENEPKDIKNTIRELKKELKELNKKGYPDIGKLPEVF